MSFVYGMTAFWVEVLSRGRIKHYYKCIITTVYRVLLPEGIARSSFCGSVSVFSRIVLRPNGFKSERLS